MRAFRYLVLFFLLLLLTGLYCLYHLSDTHPHHSPKCTSCDDSHGDTLLHPLPLRLQDVTLPINHTPSSQNHPPKLVPPTSSEITVPMIQSGAVESLDGEQSHDVVVQSDSLLRIRGGIQNLSNVVIRNGNSEHHIFSAYYDDRPLPYRPAIMLLGYVRSRSRNTFYCHFTYPGKGSYKIVVVHAQFPVYS